MASNFAEQLDVDRDNAFLDTTIFADTISYRVASSGATSSIPAAVEEQIFAIFDNKANKKFTISADAANGVASPQRGDQITLNSEVWDVIDVQDVDGMFELRCVKAQGRS